ncbi:MAG: HD domain-containing phosphohydrolase [Solirubrobacteraceae bacterium]
MRHEVRALYSKARGFLPLALVVILGLATIGLVRTLEQHADASRRAEVTLGELKIDLWQLDSAAWSANVDVGGSPVQARQQIAADERAFDRFLSDLRRQSPPRALDGIEKPLRANYATTAKIYEIGSARGYGGWMNKVEVLQNESQAVVFGLLDRADREYAASASQAQTLGLLGSSAVVVLLLAAFSLVYLRAWWAGTVAERLAATNRKHAVTDALTGLRNRRALIEDLDAAVDAATTRQPLLLALFDLDGFKQYNDTFGHAAGDALLARLSRALRSACGERATAYRVGGDEFCVLAREVEDDGAELLNSATAALSEKAERWNVGSSAGVVWLPAEASNASDALGVADVRMYAKKSSRASAGRQATDALLRVLSARDPAMQAHTSNVALLARATSEAMGLDDYDIHEITCAAELHDIGKAAIPDAILAKPGPLDADEWELMRRHTLLGERILLGAPALANAARLVRSSHERIDGAGYPDGLPGDLIPLGARIICVCDAFDAMVSERSYKRALSGEDALAELRRCAGTQFDRDVVEVFCASIEQATPDNAAVAA